MKPSAGLVAVSVSVLCIASASAVGQKTARAALTVEGQRQPAPIFRLANASGKPVGLQDFHGKALVVNLWATDCGGCRAELPEFVRLDQAYRAEGLSIVGISFDIMYEDLKSASEGWARVTPFAAERGMRYDILLDDGSAEKAFNVTALPATYLIDRKGRLAATYVGIVDATDLEANVKTLLAERP